jgi:hypothetical protein
MPLMEILDVFKDPTGWLRILDGAGVVIEYDAPTAGLFSSGLGLTFSRSF